MNKMDAKRAFGPLFAAMVLVYIAHHFIPIWDMATEGGEVLALFDYSRSVGYASWLKPLYAALPFATGFCADWGSGQLPQIRMRTGSKGYISSKLTACGLAGGCVCALGMFLFWALLTLLSGAPQVPALDEYDFAYMWEVLAEGRVALFLGALAYMEFLGGAFWALSALALSAFLPNKYYVLCFPLLLHQGYFTLLGHLGNTRLPNLLILFKGTALVPFWDTLGIATLTASLGIFLCALAFIKGMQWRFRHG